MGYLANNNIYPLKILNKSFSLIIFIQGNVEPYDLDQEEMEQGFKKYFGGFEIKPLTIYNISIKNIENSSRVVNTDSFSINY